ncbi:hypothetical protein BP6252_03243 [Coleophoma cylindrospora]|uniref:Uncharacterized protein n=1 Tax=Coleophoma cylindrospora TaxID=1849047 RepID=A0A3D8S7Q9_9HELO|nr:hypothetical protein BP6252_03243 [Coleophoma cylindrospora]
MAGDGARDGYPWMSSQRGIESPSANRYSTVSALSSPGTPDMGFTTHRSSTVSLPTPEERPQEVVDVSHVRLPSEGGSGITSPSSGLSIQNRMSLPESLRVGTPISPNSRTFNPFSRIANTAYEPISAARRSSLSKPGARRFSTKKKVAIITDSSIPEEEIDMGLLQYAAPFTSRGTAYKPLGGTDDDDFHVTSPVAAGFDISSFGGPLTPQSEAQLQELHLQEAQGILTGGLGAGFKPGATLKSTELFATADPAAAGTVSRNLSRRLSHRVSSHSARLQRTATIRDLGQNEANKRGEIIEVIMEDAPVDLSTYEGGNASTTDFEMVDDASKRKSTMRSGNVEVFYPQANWRPFSMRWPYLAALIMLSVVLAGAQEYVYQKSMIKPLYEFNRPSDLNTWDYFCFKYLPTLIAVAFGVLWQITDFEVKRLEAYYQLSKSGGALAAESINVDYITFFDFLRPIRALRCKHHAVVVSSFATLLAVSLVPTLQSSSVVLSPDRLTREADPDGLKNIRMSGVFSRFLSVVLLLVALLGCVLLWQLQRRRSGLVADVKGIAGIAAMANRSHILMDFKDMDTATPDMIYHKLKDHRYTLQNSSLAPDDQVPLTRQEKDRYDQQQRKTNPHPFMLRLPVGIMVILGMLLFMGLIPVVLFTDANIVTDKAPWFVTGLAVCIKLAWGSIETDVRMMEPFYLLSKRHAPPKVLTLDYSSMPFAWMPLCAFLNGHLLMGLVGLGSVLAEVLTVCAISFSGVAGRDFTGSPGPHVNYTKANSDLAHNASEETLLSFWLSFGLAYLILAFLSLVAIFVYARRRHTFLPRQPNTIASILAYIHQSKMLYDFVGTEKMNNDEMVTHLEQIGKRYGVGWFTGRDGEVHCGVDEEELVSGYKHGDDARKASMPWSTDWEHY